MPTLNTSPLLLREVAAGGDAFQIEKSLRFNDDDSPGLLRTIQSSGNRKTWTWSGWVKRGNLGIYGTVWGYNASNGSQGEQLRFDDDNQLTWYDFKDGASYFRRKSNKYFRDPSAWLHIVCRWDTSDSVAADRMRYYVNGEQITSYVGDDPSQNHESQSWNVVGYPNGVGRNGAWGGNYMDGQIADCYFLDGVSLSPAAFGYYDSSGCWQPRQLTRPSFNKDVTWSTGSTNCTNPANAFDGSESTYAEASSAGARATITIPETTAQEVRMHISSSTAGEVYINDKQVNTWSSNPSGWVRCPWDGKPITSVGFGSGSQATCYRVEFDGIILVTDALDGDTTTITNPNYGGDWSDHFTGTFHSNGQGNAVNTFDWNLDTQSFGADDSELTFKPPHKIVGRIDAWLYAQGSTTGKNDIKLNGTSVFSSVQTQNGAATWGWAYLGDSIDTTDGLVIGRHDNDNKCNIRAIRCDGAWLVDELNSNSFHLKFNDTGSNRRLGKDSYSGKIEEISGAKPILTTTDDYGEVTEGAVDTSDPDKASIVLAIAGSGTLADVRHTVKGSGSARTLTGGASLTTDESVLYGSSIHFNGDTKVSAGNVNDWDFGTGDYCVELWMYTTNTSGYVPLMSTRDNNGWRLQFTPSDNWKVKWGGGSSDGEVCVSGSNAVVANQWYHIAATRSGSTVRLFINGTVAASATNSESWAHGHDLELGDTWPSGMSQFTGYMQDIRVYKGAAKYDKAFKPPIRNSFASSNLSADGGQTTVDNATGGLPIYNTTGAHGTVKGSGVRTDSNASNLSVAIPMNGSHNAQTFTDESGNSHSISAQASVVTSPINCPAKFYGSCGYFDGDGDYLSLGTDTDWSLDGDFTMECWMYLNSGQKGIIASIGDNNTSTGFTSYAAGNGDYRVYGNQEYWFGTGNGTFADQTWNHFALVRESGVAKVYINGTDIGKTYSSTTTWAGALNVGAELHNNGYDHHDGGLTDFRLYKGLAKYTSNFKVPAYGTPENLDSFVDSPTSYGEDTGVGGEVRGTYCTWNSNSKTGSSNTLSQGNLKCVTTTNACTKGTFAMTSGKWYFEYLIGGTATQQIGIVDVLGEQDSSAPGGSGHNGYIYLTNVSGNANTGHLYHNGTASITTWPTVTTGDIVTIAYDADTGKLWWGKEGTWFNDSSGNTGNPATGANPAITVDSSYKNRMVPVVGAGGGSDAANGHVNFGQRAYKHTAPTDFKVLCTKNLPDTFSGAAVNNPSKYFDIALWTGNGDTAQTIPTTFGPDMVWFKERSNTSSHAIVDNARGATNAAKVLYPDRDDAQATATSTSSITSLDSDGFTIGSSDGSINADGDTYIGWCWDAGTAAVTASDLGDITPSAQWVNATAGFSMSTYTGTFSSAGVATIGHGLGAPPEMIISKELGNSSRWAVKHVGLTNWDYILELNENVAQVDKSGGGDTDDPTNTVFGTNHNGGINVDGYTYIAYCWTPIAGYSAFGSYNGNGGTSGPFVWCGFSPKFLMVKSFTQTADWQIYDLARQVGNPRDHVLKANSNAAEESHMNHYLDLLSNGFKPRMNTTNINSAGQQYIFAAFADHPFKLARARS